MSLFSTPSAPRKKATLKVPPVTPETHWRPPKTFPRLQEAQGIDFDLETHERDFDRGPGWSRGKSSIVGIAVYAWFSDGSEVNEYFPCGHIVEPEYNLDSNNVMAWVRDWASTSIPKYNANLTYDIGTLTDAGIKVNGSLHDCEFAEALLDEFALVDLDTLGEKHLGIGKETNQLDDWLTLAYGSPSHDNIHRTSPRLVAPYAKRDAWVAAQVVAKQWPLIHSKGLTYLYNLEHDLIPLLIKMRQAGVRIDIPKAELLHAKLTRQTDDIVARIKAQIGFEIPATCPHKLMMRLFQDYLKLEPPISYKSGEPKPSFSEENLKGINHPIIKDCKDMKFLQKLNNTFVRNYLLEGVDSKGFLHAQFNPLKLETSEGKKGARTGRFSGSNPNLQNIPVGTEGGNEIRELFIPDYGHEGWVKIDYSQIEYRWLTHFAVGPGANEVRDAYRKNPKTDFHTQTQKRVQAVSGLLMPRKREECTKETGHLTIKELNFGMVYGQGQTSLMKLTGLPATMAQKVLDAYHEANPYVKATMKSIQDEVQRTGEVRTILGRVTHFDLWEPKQHGDFRAHPLPVDEAIRKWGMQIQRAYTHKAINYKLQGSAGDLIKAAMRDAHRIGLFDVLGVPRLTVHDELDFSRVNRSKAQQEAYQELIRVMEKAIPCAVPILAEPAEGPNWGSCKG